MDSGGIFVDIHFHLVVNRRVILLCVVERVEVSVDEITFVGSFRGGSVQSRDGEHRLTLLERIEPWKSLVAGSTAGAVEGLVTYPFEWSKTRLQLVDKSSTASRNPLVLIYNTAKTQGLGAVYTGCPAFIVGNTVKAGVRFLGFDAIKGMLADKDGKVSGPRGVLAGLGAGVLESVVAVTPFETIKTAMIDDRQSKNPKYQGLFKGTARLIKDKGISGIYRGLVPVTMRQAANQAVRLGSILLFLGRPGGRW